VHASVDVLLCTLQSFGAHREQLWCLGCRCQTDHFAHWRKLWGAGTNHGLRISRTLARASAWKPTGLANAQGLENIYPFLLRSSLQRDLPSVCKSRRNNFPTLCMMHLAVHGLQENMRQQKAN